MKSKYDCVVVGAGPAGLMAAKTLGESGQESSWSISRRIFRKSTGCCCTMPDQ